MSEDVYTRPGPTDDTYETLRFPLPANTAQRGGNNNEPKKNCYRAASASLGLLCLLLLAGIIGLVIHNSVLIKHLDQIQTRYDNLTAQMDQLRSSYYKLTVEEERRRLCETRGFTLGGGVCYYVSTEKKTWKASRQYCRESQSDLIVTNSKEKQDFVERLDKWVWLGLTDRAEEGVWEFVDGKPLTTPTYWRSGEPNNKGPSSEAEDCVEFVTLKGRRGWNDRPCSAVNYWVCEMLLS